MKFHTLPKMKFHTLHTLPKIHVAFLQGKKIKMSNNCHRKNTAKKVREIFLEQKVTGKLLQGWKAGWPALCVDSCLGRL